MPNQGLTHLLSREERHALGKAARRRVPREAHADLSLAPGRNAYAIIEAQNRQRIPFLVPERLKRMSVSAFSYFRGAAAVMAADLKQAPMAGFAVQASGDCHILNFGSFISPEGRILFDVNDFDETLPGVDFTVDIKRLAASLAVAADDAGLSRKRGRAIAARAVRSYRRMMRELAGLSPYEIWQQRIDLVIELDRIDDKRLRTHIAACLNRVEADLIGDDNIPHLDPASSTPRFEDREGKIYHDNGQGAAALVSEAAEALQRYPAELLAERRALLARYALVDIAIKVVGVGSVGTLCAIGLYATPDGDKLVLQIKEAKRSVLVGLLDTGHMQDDGRRVVEGQRALQAATDVFLGSVPRIGTNGKSGAKIRPAPQSPMPTPDRHFYVRQLKTQKLASLATLITRDIHDADALMAYGELTARTLARAHARTGDTIAISAYMGASDTFDSAIGDFAVSYADLATADHKALVAHLASP